MLTSEETFIGRYKIIKEIGRGAMSVVYQAEDPDIGRMIAIKLLKHELIEQQEFRDLFIREAKSAGRLSHPSIVTIFDTGIWNERPFIAMELLKGRTLDEYLLEHKTMELDKLLPLAKQLTKALEYAHENGVIHRDLKPENIFVLDGEEHFKIADFGIAKLENEFLQKETDNRGGDESSKERKVMGTPAYMSPEQIAGNNLDAKTDFYSLGVILYQATKGELPFRAKNHVAMMQAVLQKNPRPLNLTTPSGLLWQSIIFRLLQKNPDLRYESSELLINEIDNLTKEYNEDKGDLSQMRFVSMGSRWAVGLTSVVLLVMIFGLAWVYKRQTDLMTQLMYDYGFSVTQIISKEIAEPLLLDENLTLQSLTDKVTENNQVLYLSIRDNDDKVVSSNNKSEANKQYQLLADEQLVEKHRLGQVYLDSSYENNAYRFESAIIYQDKKVGRVAVTLSRNNLTKATNRSLMAMLLWMVLIVFVVFLGTYWLARKFIQRVNLSKQTLHEFLSHGQADTLSIDSHDEIGRLQQEINALLQKYSDITKTQQIKVNSEQLQLNSEQLEKTAADDKKPVDKTLIL